MKNICVLLIVVMQVIWMGATAQTGGGVSIGKGDVPANPKAILELVSKTKGLLIPRMTETERLAIFSEADQTAKGLMVFDNTRQSFYFWDGSVWQSMAAGSIRTVSGAPTGAGTTGELVYDGQNSLLYIYYGGNWLNLGGGSLRVINDLVTGGAAYALSADQGRVLEQKKIDRAVEFGGDVSGTYDNLHIRQGTVTTTEIEDRTILGIDIHDMGATSGQVLVWDGQSWKPGTVGGGAGGNVVIINDLTTGGSASALSAEMGRTLNATKLATDAAFGGDVGGTFGNLQINPGAIGASDLGAMGATVAGQVLIWDGQGWKPGTVQGGTGGGDITSVTAVNGLAGGATSGDVFVGLAPIDDQTIFGNNTGASAAPTALTASDVKSILALTKSDVGLDQVDNTSDLAKPVSTLTQAALDAKVDENPAIPPGTATKITYDSKGLVTAGTNATTADIAPSTNKRYVTDAQLAVIGNTTGTNTGDQTISLSGNTLTMSGTGSMVDLSSLSGSDITEIETENGLTGGGTSGTVTLGLASINPATILGNNTALSAVPTALTASDVKSILALTKSDVGLDQVDNTSDLAKPVSILTQAALDAKVDENPAITPGTATKITYDSKGLVTAGANATTADIVASSDHNYVTNAELAVIQSTSGTNTGDQDLNPYALKTDVLTLDNTTAFTPDADYEPATKIYVDDLLASAGGTFDANKIVTRTGLDGITGENFGTTTVTDFLNKLFFPVLSPVISSFRYGDNSSAGQYSYQTADATTKVVTDHVGTVTIPYSSWSSTSFSLEFNYDITPRDLSGTLTKVELLRDGISSLESRMDGATSGSFTLNKGSFTNVDVTQNIPLTLKVTDDASNLVSLVLNTRFTQANGVTLSNTRLSATSSGSALTTAEGSGTSADPYLIARTGSNLNYYFAWNINANDDAGKVTDIDFDGSPTLTDISGTNVTDTYKAVILPNSDASTTYQIKARARGSVANDWSGYSSGLYYKLQDKTYCGFLASNVEPLEAAIKGLQQSSLKTTTYYNATTGVTLANNSGGSGFFTWAIPTYVDGSAAQPTSFSKTPYYYATGQWFENTDIAEYYVKVTTGSSSSWYWVCIYNASTANGNDVQAKLSNE